MRTPFVQRMPKPRNPVVVSLLRRLASGAAGKHRDDRRASRRQGQKDLDQRVREVGEW